MSPNKIVPDHKLGNLKPRNQNKGIQKQKWLNANVINSNFNKLEIYEDNQKNIISNYQEQIDIHYNKLQ